MKITKIKKIKRLIKKAEFINGFEERSLESGMLSIYKNPTSQEIKEAMEESDYKDSVRGIISQDGTEYCWAGSILHASLPTEANLPINDSFRFAYDGGIWIFDLNKKMTFKEGMEKFIEYKDKLSKYGDMTDELTFWYALDSSKYYREYDEKGVARFSSDSIGIFGDNVEVLLEEIKDFEN